LHPFKERVQKSVKNIEKEKWSKLDKIQGWTKKNCRDAVSEFFKTHFSILRLRF